LIKVRGKRETIQPPLVTTLIAPSSTVMLNGSSTENPFTLVVKLSNTAPGATQSARGISTILTLPDGLELAPGENARHDIPDLDVGEEYQTSYQIKIKPTAAGHQVYFLLVEGTNINSKTVEKDIFVFGIQTNPPDGGQIHPDDAITATFNIDMDANTINTETFIVSDGENIIDGIVNYDKITRTIKFKPNLSLESGKEYHARLKTAIKSLDGIGLSYDVGWKFVVSSVQPKFSFVHMSDVHIGWSTIKAKIKLSEIDIGSSIIEIIKLIQARSRLYDAFIDMKLKNYKPDFILITGDLVESTKDSNLYKFKRLLKKLEKNYNIPIYFVPGNHDRYKLYPREMIKYGFKQITTDIREKVDDYLKEYYKVFGSPESFMQNVNILPGFENFSYGKNTVFGLDWYNYSFIKKGYLFIGLDSGADYKISKKPKSYGLNDIQFLALDSLFRNYNIPKIIFMHHPITFNKNDSLSDNESFHFFRKKFFNYCKRKENKVLVVLAGHTHESHVYDGHGNDYTQTQLNFYPASIGNPFFIQTPSAVKDEVNEEGIEYPHGYRVIDVYENYIKVHKYTKTSTTIPKDIIVSLGPVFINVYDSEGRHTGHDDNLFEIPNSYYTGFYSDTIEQAIILYDTTLNYNYQVKAARQGYYSLNISSIAGIDTTIFMANQIPITQKGIHEFNINWKSLKIGEKGVTLKIDSDGDGQPEKTLIVGDTLNFTIVTPQTGGILLNNNVYFYPNPFNPEINTGLIRYSLSKPGKITIKIYNIAGELVKTLIENEPEKNQIELSTPWDGRDDQGDIVSNGVYFYVIESSSGEKAVGKIAVLR